MKTIEKELAVILKSYDSNKKIIFVENISNLINLIREYEISRVQLYREYLKLDSIPESIFVINTLYPQRKWNCFILSLRELLDGNFFYKEGSGAPLESEGYKMFDVTVPHNSVPYVYF